MAPATHSPTDLGPRRLLDVAEAAEATGLHPRTVRRMFDERLVPVVKVGRLVRVWSTDLAAYFDANTLPSRAGVTR